MSNSSLTRAPMRSCGKRYTSEAEATSAAVLLTEKSSRPGTFHPGQCRAGCGGWHVTYRKPAKTAQEKRQAPRDTGPDAKTRALVLARDGHCCVRCGMNAGPGIGAYSIQHRIARGVGGGNEVTNLLLLCGTATTGCHGEVEAKQDPHDHAAGYRLESWQVPAAEPVMLHSAHGSGITMWPTADGHWSETPPEGAEAA